MHIKNPTAPRMPPKKTYGEGKTFFDFVKIQNEKQRYNQKTEHSEDPLCADPLSTPKIFAFFL